LAAKLQVYIEQLPKLRDPIMVCGLPDSGNVAKLVIDQLVKQLKAKRFAEIYSHSLPPRVLIRQDGTVEPMKHSMYYCVSNNGARDLILYTGDLQPSNPEAAYALAEKALEIGQSLGAGLVFTVGAYVTGEFPKEPKVFGTATDKELLEEFEGIGVTRISEGNITWMNGLLMGLSRLRNLKAIFLSGETSGYIVDAKAARAVLRVLGRKLEIPIDMSELEPQAAKSEALVKSMKEIQDKANETGYIG
jgi:uncharacterized protein (TIGR00162 family)